MKAKIERRKKKFLAILAGKIFERNTVIVIPIPEGITRKGRRIKGIAR